MRVRFRSVLPALLFLVSSAGWSMEGRLLLPGGKPASGSQVTIPGVPGSARADHQGRFVIGTRVEPPFTMIVIGTRGEIYPPVIVTALPQSGTLDIHLEPTLRESITISSGVAPNIEAPPASGTSVIGREEIEERHPEHLVEVLVRSPGLQIRGEGPPAVPIVRGLAGGRTLILLDDARVTAERRAGPSATFLNPFTLGTVEVSRGPGSVAYGS